VPAYSPITPVIAFESYPALFFQFSPSSRPFIVATHVAGTPQAAENAAKEIHFTRTPTGRLFHSDRNHSSPRGTLPGLFHFLPGVATGPYWNIAR
jgi:hypothetical protein